MKNKKRSRLETARGTTAAKILNIKVFVGNNKTYPNQTTKPKSPSTPADQTIKNRPLFIPQNPLKTGSFFNQLTG